MNLVQCRNTGYCEPFRCGMFEDLNAWSYSAPWYIQSTHLQCPTPPGELKLLFFTESLLHLNVLCAVLGILLLVIRLCCGNSSLKVNFLLNECSYGHGQDLRNDVQKKKTKLSGCHFLLDIRTARMSVPSKQNVIAVPSTKWHPVPQLRLQNFHEGQQKIQRMRKERKEKRHW